MPLRRLRRLILVALTVVGLGLTGCSPMDQGAIMLDDATGRPALVVALCEGEGIRAIRLTTADDDGNEGRTLWRIEAEGLALDQTTFVVGEIPEGFVEKVPFTETELPKQMSLVSENGGDAAGIQHGGYFERDELRPGVLVQGGREVGKGTPRRNAEMNCSGSLFGSLGLPPWLDWVALGLLGAGVVAVVVSAWRQRRRAIRR